MGLERSRLEELQRWLLHAPHVQDGGETFLRDLVAELRVAGLPVWRASVCLLTMHPEVFWRNVQWHDGEAMQVFARRHEVLATPYFTTSPIVAIRRGEGPFHVRLRPGTLPFPVCEDLRERGGTDYYVQGLVFSNGAISYASWATREPGGFDDESCATLDLLCPHLARRVELESAYYGTRSLLEVYLGGNAARRVLAGAFRRGEGELIDAAIWFCDMRDFTSTSDRVPPGEVVRMLDAYFERVAGAIARHGGEVLKFVGDAVLAIFPVDATRDARSACRSALEAARDGLASVEALSAERVRTGGAAVRIGVALHRGQVMYGNIGGNDRLDFTVISSSVNETCRLEALCKPLDTPLVLSEAFVTAADAEGVVDLGQHELKGLVEPVRVYTLVLESVHRQEAS